MQNHLCAPFAGNVVPGIPPGGIDRINARSAPELCQAQGHQTDGTNAHNHNAIPQADIRYFYHIIGDAHGLYHACRLQAHIFIAHAYLFRCDDIFRKAHALPRVLFVPEVSAGIIPIHFAIPGKI